MTRNDYEVIAEVIKGRLAHTESYGQKSAIVHVAEDLATLFKGDNARFDTTTFLKACGVTVEVSPGSGPRYNINV